MEALRMPIKALGYRIAGEMKVFGKFEAGIVGEDRTILEEAVQLGGKITASLEEGRVEG